MTKFDQLKTELKVGDKIYYAGFFENVKTKKDFPDEGEVLNISDEGILISYDGIYNNLKVNKLLLRKKFINSDSTSIIILNQYKPKQVIKKNIVKEIHITKTVWVANFTNTWIDWIYNNYCKLLGRKSEIVTSEEIFKEIEL